MEKRSVAEQSPLVELQFPRMRAECGGYFYELVYEQGRMALGVQLALLLLVARCDSSCDELNETMSVKYHQDPFQTGLFLVRPILE